MPPSGARLLVASDGVWDAYEKMSRIGSMLRTWSLDSSPQRLIQVRDCVATATPKPVAGSCQGLQTACGALHGILLTQPFLPARSSCLQSIVRAYGGLRDDTTLVIADIVAPGRTFPECAAAAVQRAKAAASAAHHSSGSGGGGGCGCFGGGPTPPPPVEPAVPAAPAPAAAPEMEVLADVDVAAVMGLMPGSTPIIPGWYNEFVGEHLFALAVSGEGSGGEALWLRHSRSRSKRQ